MTAWDDKALLSEFIAGKERALKVVFERYYEKLFVFCFGIISNTQEAEDIALVTLNKLFERHADFQSVPQIHTWLFRTARNNCIDCLRQRKRKSERDLSIHQILFDGSENQSINDELDVLLMERINDLVGELPPRSQQVIRLRYLESLKYKEIATKLSISPRTVENLLRYALERMRNQLCRKKLVMVLILLGTCLS